MAREESDREDLMAEAVGLTPRIELAVGSNEPTDPIVLGRRRDDGFSMYFGADPVFHFDAANRLRRAFVGGLLHRTTGTTVAVMVRERTADRVVLNRRDLTGTERDQFLKETGDRVTGLVTAIDDGRVTMTRAEPPDVLTDELIVTLRTISERPICLAPPIGGRR